jgi:hypothetical protein
MMDREVERYAGTLRHADHGSRGELQMIEQGAQIGHVRGNRGTARGKSESSAVDPDHPKRLAELCRLRLPRVEIERPPVKEDHRSAITFVTKAQADIAVFEVLVRGLHASPS